MARTKQTARKTTGSHPAPRVGAAATGRVIGHRIAASSSDPPVASYQLGDSIYALLAQHAEEDLTRLATYRYEDIVEPFLTGIVSRSARTNIINVFKKQIQAEQGSKAPEETKNSGNPMPDSDSEAEEEEYQQAAATLLSIQQAPTDPEPVPQTRRKLPGQTRRKRAPVDNRIFTKTKKTQGGVSFIKAQTRNKTPGYWVATYKNYRRCGFTSEEAARAKLNQWKIEDLCPCCEQNWPI
jgi:hypothetical protein